MTSLWGRVFLAACLRAFVRSFKMNREVVVPGDKEMLEFSTVPSTDDVSNCMVLGIQSRKAPMGSLGTRLVDSPKLSVADANRFKIIRGIGDEKFTRCFSAWDNSTDQMVMLKFFTLQDRYISWQMVNDPLTGVSTRQVLRQAIRECKVAKDMRVFDDQDPQGASRLMDCYEDHISPYLQRSEPDAQNGEVQDDGSKQEQQHAAQWDQTILTGHSMNDSRVNNSLPFLVMQFGGNLTLWDWRERQERLLKEGSLSAVDYLQQVWGIWRQLLVGLRYMTAHHRQWVHHDVKMSNVMINKHHIMLTGFGSTTEVAEGADALGKLTITPAYVPPEGVDHTLLFMGVGGILTGGYNAHAPHSFDMYSAGVILDALLTGRFVSEKINSTQHWLAESQVEACQRGLLLRAFHDSMGTLEDAGLDRCSPVDELLTVMKSYVPEKAWPNEFPDPGTAEDAYRQMCISDHNLLYLRDMKRPGGAEQYYTMSLGQMIAGLSWGDVAGCAYRKMEDVFMAPALHEFLEVTRLFRLFAKEGDWYQQYWLLFAYNAEKRPSAAAMLQHQFMQSFPEFVQAWTKTPERLLSNVAPDSFTDQPMFEICMPDIVYGPHADQLEDAFHCKQDRREKMGLSASSTPSEPKVAWANKPKQSYFKCMPFCWNGARNAGGLSLGLGMSMMAWFSLQVSANS